jgi:hypothetical protein
MQMGDKLASLSSAEESQKANANQPRAVSSESRRILTLAPHTGTEGPGRLLRFLSCDPK